jgi:ATP/ADP translocase
MVEAVYLEKCTLSSQHTIRSSVFKCFSSFFLLFFYLHYPLLSRHTRKEYWLP